MTLRQTIRVVIDAARPCSGRQARMLRARLDRLERAAARDDSALALAEGFERAERRLQRAGDSAALEADRRHAAIERRLGEAMDGIEAEADRRAAGARARLAVLRDELEQFCEALEGRVQRVATLLLGDLEEATARASAVLRGEPGHGDEGLQSLASRMEESIEAGRMLARRLGELNLLSEDSCMQLKQALAEAQERAGIEPAVTVRKARAAGAGAGRAGEVGDLGKAAPSEKPNLPDRRAA